jgi:GAF domain-containing protein
MGAADTAALSGTFDAAAAIWAEQSLTDVLERLGKAIGFVVGATATMISKIEGDRLADTTRHTLRDIDLGEDNTYLISDYPVTRDALATRSVASVSFLDEEIDSAEAFVLRELNMNAVMLVPLVVHGRSWGLVELYDMRLRQFTPEDEAVAFFLVEQAGRKIETLGKEQRSRRRLLRLGSR